MRYTLTIANWNPPTLNATLGRHWRKAHKAKVDTANLLAAEALNQGVPKATGKRRVSLRVSGWARGGRLPDGDSMDKCFLDAAVRSGLLTDDDAKGLDGRMTVVIERGPKFTEITLEDCE